MSVAKILADKGSEIVTIGPESRLVDAVSVLHARRIGAVVVVDGRGGVAGIVSERDVVRALGSRGRDALEDPVSAWMTAEVVTCSRSAGIPELMTTMTEGKFRHVPVVEAGRLAGIVSIGDIVKHRIAEMDAEHQAMRDYIATA